VIGLRSIAITVALARLALAAAVAAAPAGDAPRLLSSSNVAGSVMALSVGPGATSVTYAITSTVLARIDTRTGRIDTLHVFWVPPAVPEPLAHGMTSNIVLSPRGDWIACAADGKLAIVDARTRRALAALRAPGTDLGSLARSPDGDRIAGAGQGFSGIAIWKAANGQLLQRFRTESATPTNALAWSPAGDVIALAGLPSPQVSLWDPSDGRRAGSLPTGGGWSTSPTFSPDGRRLFVLVEGVRLTAWDVKTHKLIWRSSALRFGGSLGLAISPDGRFLLSSLAPDELALFDTSDGRLVCHWSDPDARGDVVAFCPDRPIVVSAGLRGHLHVWDVSGPLARARVRRRR